MAASSRPRAWTGIRGYQCLGDESQDGLTPLLIPSQGYIPELTERVKSLAGWYFKTGCSGAGQRNRGLLQLRVLRLGLLQDRDIGVSVFPKGEKVLICSAGFSTMP